MGLEICGRWEAVGFSCFAYNFLPDGTGYYSMAEAKKEFTYSIDGNSITIYYPGDIAANVFEFAICDDILSIQDSFGNFVNYKKKM